MECRDFYIHNYAEQRYFVLGNGVGVMFFSYICHLYFHSTSMSNRLHILALAAGLLFGGAVQMAGSVPGLSDACAGGTGYSRLQIENELAREPYSTSRELLMLRLGDTYFFERDFVEASACYAEVAADALVGGAAVDYSFRYGYALMQLGMYDEASAVLAAMPDYANRIYVNAAVFYRAYIAFVQGKTDEAYLLFERVDDTKEPGTARDCYLAQLEYTRGNIAAALRLARRADELPLPADLRAENNRVIGECLYLQDHRREGVEYLWRYANAVDNPARSALYIIGLSEYEQGRYDSAIKELEPVTDGDDTMAQSAWLYIGQARLQSGDSNAAMRAFDRAQRMDADEAVQEAACYNYAVAGTRGGQVPFGSSVSAFENFLRRYPASTHAAQVRAYLVNGYIIDHNYDEALRSINAVASPSAELLTAKQRVLYALGARELAAGRPAEALDYLKEARKYARYDADVNAETYLLSGDAAYKLEDYRTAVADYRRYLAMAPADAANVAGARYNLGYAYFALKEFNNAASEFALAADAAGLSDAVRADALCRLGDCRYYTSDFKGALSHYRRAVEANPAGGDYASFQSAAMQGFMRQYSDKIATLEKMEAAYPQSALMPSVLLEKAVTYLQLSRTDDAIIAYRNLVARYPRTEAGRNGYLQLAQTLNNIGRDDEAADAYRDIIKKYPTSDEARLSVVALKRNYVEADRIDELADFLNSVPGAPTLSASEVEKMAFTAAESHYLSTRETARLERYLNNYPAGVYASQALSYLADDAYSRGDAGAALDYASRIITTYPDSPAMEGALEIKAEIMLGSGDIATAREAYIELLARTSTPAHTDAARMGLMRVAYREGEWTQVVSHADALLASTTVADAARAEVRFLRTRGLEKIGRTSEAVAGYAALASAPDDIFGAQAAVALAELYLSEGNASKSCNVAEKFVGSSSPHAYWIARGFIVLSDANRALGKTFEADEYLTALRQNYPGDEADIFRMIDQRLDR